MTRVASYDPGRIRDRFAMVGADVKEKEIKILNAKEWFKTNFIFVEDEIAEINSNHKFDYHICETNNQGWHVIDNLRTLKNIPVRGVNTSNNLKPGTARLGKSLDKNVMVEWIEWAREDGIITMPQGKWSPGITELNRQLNRFVMKRSGSGYKYEAAEDDDHDDLVMALVVLCHFAKMRLLRLGGRSGLWGYGAGDHYEQHRPKSLGETISDKMKKRFENSGFPTDQMRINYRRG